jgi:hypothetical protein
MLSTIRNISGLDVGLFRPSGAGVSVLQLTHGLRRGLHSSAASRLGCSLHGSFLVPPSFRLRLISILPPSGARLQYGPTDSAKGSPYIVLFHFSRCHASLYFSYLAFSE